MAGCPNKALIGGCPLHNLHCGYPECDRGAPAAPVVEPPSCISRYGCFHLEQCTKAGHCVSSPARTQADDVPVEPPAQDAELIARLRENCTAISCNANAFQRDEAADRLAALAEELARWRHRHDMQVDRACEAERQLAAAMRVVEAASAMRDCLVGTIYEHEQAAIDAYDTARAALAAMDKGQG